ncbi:hypothetical protein [Streptomyces alkaliterrae]|uniref:Fibronectin type III domain-containing protein n=1 Tax=Streptomyces alkaliterrae TaxID=2213162 RepID=A0A5P0YTM4_9ACTN|nr:hypothetical protein [Streptomyces alkaliterrae]MBB1260604.1 hypothetical protein [Streptomyces alkaliterrae]MQS03661.1 hypothetical protein [Streptomyces alkaliterrae]
MASHRVLKLTALTAVPLTLTSFALPASASSAQPPRAETATFSFAKISSSKLADVSGVSAAGAQGRTADRHGFRVLRAPSGETAVVDSSLAHQGITAAAGTSFVDLSWKGYADNARYAVLRDGREVAKLGAGVTSFRDRRVSPGTQYDYQVLPVLPEGGAKGAKLWGVKVSVPASGSLTGLRGQAASRAQSAKVASTTTLSWITFIPQKRINAPSAGCDYGTKFQFGGDDRTAFDWKSSRYRTALHATITWKDKSVKGNKHVRPTHVYRKSDGKEVAKKTATDKNMEAKKLGSGSNNVDVRMVLHATNPFCKGLGGVKGAISGAFTMNLTTSGNYAIRSGKYRLMPNHHIYIYDGGKVTNVLTRKYADAKCLVGSILCREADLTGYYGKF